MEQVLYLTSVRSDTVLQWAWGGWIPSSHLESENLNSLSLLVVGSASYLFLGGEAHKAFLVKCQLPSVGGEVQKL